VILLWIFRFFTDMYSRQIDLINVVVPLRAR